MKKIIILNVHLLWILFLFAGCATTQSKPYGDTIVLKERIKDSNIFLSECKIIIPTTLWACDHMVTQGEYKAVMGTNPSYFSSNPAPGEIQENRPVDSVSWYNALVYCNKLSIMEGLTPCYTIKKTRDPDLWGETPKTLSDKDWDVVICDFSANGYRLPTKVEWAYLSRGGNLTNEGQTLYSGSDTADEVAWTIDTCYYIGNKGRTYGTHEVKKLKPNALGLYDMSGNLFEWCWDGYKWAPLNGMDGPKEFIGTTFHYEAGGCWDWGPYKLDAITSTSPDGSWYNGFRVVRSSID